MTCTGVPRERNLFRRTRVALTIPFVLIKSRQVTYPGGTRLLIRTREPMDFIHGNSTTRSWTMVLVGYKNGDPWPTQPRTNKV